MKDSQLLGRGHKALLDWLIQSWIPQGPPVCFLDGFSGVGKTTVARLLPESPERPVVMIAVPETDADASDDLLLDMAMALSDKGRGELAQAIDDGKSLPQELLRVLQSPVLIVIDEFQRALPAGAGEPARPLANILSRLANQPQLPGRVLLLSNRLIEAARWSEPHEKRTLHGLAPDEAEILLERQLAEAGRQAEVPHERRQEVVGWLGGNPRAIRLLVASLAHDSLDDLIGLLPDTWELRDREVSPELASKLERDLLNHSMSRLSEQDKLQLRRLAVYRKPFKPEAIEEFIPDKAAAASFKNELVNRFLIEHHQGWFSLHPIVREISLQRLKETEPELRQAHGMASRYYTRHFTARQLVGAGRLGGHFVEARYHLVNAGRADELRAIVSRFEAHIKSTITSISPVPRSADELNERIAMLAALLEEPGAKGLEYHLAKLFQARGGPDDLRRALLHAQRSIGARAPAPNWFLYGQLLVQDGRADEAIALLKDGIRRVPLGADVVSLYQSCGELLARAGRVDKAITLLQEGIRSVPINSVFALYRSCGELLARAGRIDEAIALLREGIRSVPDNSAYPLYQSCSELLARAGRVDEAIALLREGIRTIPQGKYNRYKLQESVLLLLAARRNWQGLDAVLAADGPDRLDEPQTAFGRILLLQVQGRWRDAAEAAASARAQFPSYFALASLEAFCWLGAGDAVVAATALDRFTSIDYERQQIAWLRTLIAARLGNAVDARAYLTRYLGRAPAPDLVIDVPYCLSLWDQPSAPWGEPDLAYYYPTLPPAITGLDRPVTRVSYHPSVLPAHVKGAAEQLADPAAGAATPATPAAPAAAQPMPEQASPAALRQILREYFNDGELRDLCSDLRIDYESLPGQGKDDRARELVDYARRHGRTGELVAECRRLRPKADWREDPS